MWGLPLSVSACPIRCSSASTAPFDWTETHTSLKGTRNAARHEALAAWRATRERQGGLSAPAVAPPLRPAPERQRFFEAYQALGWLRERCDHMLNTLAAAYCVALYSGGPSHMTAEELEASYRDAQGTLSLTVSWRGD
jgi:hypothetical protein